jgi:uncharacterized protein (TIGR00255 family)
MASIVQSSFVLSSMTGQAEASETNSLGEVHVQIKSLNHRFRDVKFKLPTHLQMTELTLRKVLENMFKRGSFDVIVNVKYNESFNLSSRVNLQKVTKYLQQFENISFKGKESIELTAFLRSEFIDDVGEDSLVNINLSLHRCMTKACMSLLQQRREEGEKIRLLLVKYHQEILKHLNFIKAKQFESYEHKKNKLQTKLKELTAGAVDEQRIAQEFTIMAQKLDIQEELDRFVIHWKKLEVLLSEKYEKADRGKELEFILQELGREINTMSNKSEHAYISQECVAIKVLLENIREQILNLE